MLIAPQHPTQVNWSNKFAHRSQIVNWTGGQTKVEGTGVLLTLNGTQTKHKDFTRLGNSSCLYTRDPHFLMSGTTAHTWAFVSRIWDFSVAFAGLVIRSKTNGPGTSFGIDRSSSDVLRVRVNDNSVNLTGLTPSGLADGLSHRHVITRDDTAFKWYVDGELKVTAVVASGGIADDDNEYMLWGGKASLINNIHADWYLFIQQLGRAWSEQEAKEWSNKPFQVLQPKYPALSNIVIASLSGGGTSTVSNDLTLQQNIEQTINADIILQSNIAETVNNDIDLQANIANTVAADLSLSWALLNQITNDLTLQSAIIQAVQNDAQLAWQLLNHATSDLSLAWSALNQLAADLDTRFAIVETVNADLDLRAAILEIVNQDATLVWSLNSSLATVTADLDLRWGIQQQIISALDLRWGLLQTVTQDMLTQSNIAATVLAELDLRHDIVNTAAQSLDLRWDAIGITANSITLQWSLNGEQLAPIDVILIKPEKRIFTNPETRIFSAGL